MQPSSFWINTLSGRHHCYGVASCDQAYAIQEASENLLQDREFEIPSLDVLQLVNSCDCSAYDCEFISLAQRLNTKLYTSDKRILKSFPSVAISLAEFTQ
jgi:predicted nucleic acid-binding protein